LELRNFQYQNYINEYLDKVLNYYSKWSPHYFVTYFKYDCHTSVIDDRANINGGSYRMTGSMSGRKWKQIFLFPIWLTDGHGEISNQDDERGVTREMNISVTWPDSIGIRPLAEDFIWFYDNVTLKESINNHPLFIITNYTVSHKGKRTWYKVNLKNNNNKLNDIRNHISSSWTYISNNRKIYKKEIADIILNSFSISHNILNDILITDINSNTYGFGYDTNKSLYFSGV